MAIAAAHELARCAEEHGLDEEHIAPTMGDWETVPRVAAATGVQAQQEGVARLSKTRDELYQAASATIHTARQATQLLVEGGVIRQPPQP